MKINNNQYPGPDLLNSSTFRRGRTRGQQAKGSDIGNIEGVSGDHYAFDNALPDLGVYCLLEEP